jgi:hypothetical protein
MKNNQKIDFDHFLEGGMWMFLCLAGAAPCFYGVVMSMKSGDLFMAVAWTIIGCAMLFPAYMIVEDFVREHKRHSKNA